MSNNSPCSTQPNQGETTPTPLHYITAHPPQTDISSPTKSLSHASSVSGRRKARLVLLLEVGVSLTLSQGTRYLVDPSLDNHDKQLLKKELASELVRPRPHIITILCEATPTHPHYTVCCVTLCRSLYRALS